MKTAEQILHERKIKLRTQRRGNHKTRCPRCSAQRKKKPIPVSA